MMNSDTLKSTAKAAFFGLIAATAIAMSAPSAMAAVENCPGPNVPGANGTNFLNGSSCGVVATSNQVVGLFIGDNADDTDVLTLTNGTPSTNQFINNGVNVYGDTLTWAVTAGQTLNFRLQDTTVPGTFDAATAYTNTDAGAFNPVYHFAFVNVSDAADFNSLNSGVTITSGDVVDSYIANNGGYGNFVFAFVEDRTVAATDDWNDMIYAFQSVRSVDNPEPASMAIVGAGLAGLGLLRRRRRG